MLSIYREELVDSGRRVVIQRLPSCVVWSWKYRSWSTNVAQLPIPEGRRWKAMATPRPRIPLTSVDAFRLLAGHVYLSTCLFTLAIVTCDEGSLCEDNEQHSLSSHLSIVDICRKVSCKTVEMPRVGIGSSKYYNYIH